VISYRTADGGECVQGVRRASRRHGRGGMEVARRPPLLACAGDPVLSYLPDNSGVQQRVLPRAKSKSPIRRLISCRSGR
jgi:hypothetical protein